MSFNIKHILTICIVSIFLIISCEDSFVDSSSSDEIVSSENFNSKALSNDAGQRSLDLSSVKSFQDINGVLADKGLNIRVAYAETVTLGEGGANAVGQTIFANDRSKQLTSQWAPGDTRRLADGNNLTYLIYQPLAPANFGTPDQIDSEPAVDASFDTWNNVKNKSKLNIVKRPDTGVLPSIFFDGDPFVADIVEFGFLPGSILDLVLGGPGSADNVLGVTFTFIFVDGDGNPTDINGDGFADTALKEVWYNDDFLWTTDPNGPGIDIETVALHENGHALGFGHFGKISVTNSNNKLHVSPRAVMNAIVLGVQRDLLGTDKASYKSIYGHWPN